jgi:hypothetical protein
MAMSTRMYLTARHGKSEQVTGPMDSDNGVPTPLHA